MSATAHRCEGMDEVHSEDVTRRIGESLADETLCERVDELLRSHRREQLHSTTGSRAFIEELAAETRGLEEAIREIARQVQELQRPRGS